MSFIILLLAIAPLLFINMAKIRFIPNEPTSRKMEAVKNVIYDTINIFMF